MTEIERYAAVGRLLRQMKEHKSWCGETHLQKAIYIVQDGFRLDLGYRFVLYRHGPYSFDLSDSIAAMMAEDYLTVEARHMGYGPTLCATGARASLLDEVEIPKDLTSAIERVSRWIGDRGVVELERLSTALYVLRKYPNLVCVADRAQRVNELKPHVSLDDASGAVQEVDSLLRSVTTSG